MWEKSVRVERSATAEVTPGAVWALLSSSAVWSLFPGVRLAVDVAASPRGVGRLVFCVGPADGTGSEVLEVCEESPGRTISVQARTRQPAGRHVFTLSLTQARRGTEVGVALRTFYPRDTALDGEVLWRKRLTAWLKAIQAVVEQRAAWPEPGMPAAACAAYGESPELEDPVSTSASATISALPGAVWQAVRSSEASRMAMRGAYSGRVPGTPERSAGEMRYMIVRRPGGRLPGVVTVVKELDHENRITLRRVGHPQDELQVHLRPGAGGTLLVLTSRRPRTQPGTATELVTGALADELRARAQRYKVMIEEAPGW